MPNFKDIHKALVRKILENPEGFEWSLQGFGMLRLYLSDELRLHVWDSEFAVENVSTLHTHPWNFESLVIAGRVVNIRYEKEQQLTDGDEWLEQTIRCGEGGGLVGEPVPVHLLEGSKEDYPEGCIYSQLGSEIHRSVPEPGSVTIIERKFGEDTEHAYVYFKGEWVSAEPRPATPEEIKKITQGALDTWF